MVDNFDNFGNFEYMKLSVFKFISKHYAEWFLSPIAGNTRLFIRKNRIFLIWDSHVPKFEFSLNI